MRDITLIQITDPHLKAPPGSRFKARDPAFFLSACLAHAAHNYPTANALLLTGDLVQDDPLAYALLIDCVQRARPLFGRTDLPILALPGNHDVPSGFATLTPQAGFCAQPELNFEHWEVLALNSQAPGHTHGFIAPTELSRLSERLEARQAEHLLIALHHPPIAIGSAWMDEINLHNAQTLFARLKDQPVRGMVFGHIHQAFDRTVTGIRYLGTPSSVIQFKAQNDEFGLDEHLGGGYRVIHLRPDGTIESQVEWVTPGSV